MTKTTYQNEQLKRAFFTYLRGAKGFEKSSIHSYAEAVWQWQLFSDGDDFASFDESKALAFKEWLSTRPTKTKAGRLSLATQYNYLRRVKRFFSWLSDRPGFKNKILKGDVEFLRLSNKDALIARSGSTRANPTLEEARKLIEGIEIKNEVDQRDRALISFAAITGCRISALISLRMKNFDKEKRLVSQNPGDGVHTKDSKKILTPLYPIGWDAPEQYFMEWFEHREATGSQADDPIFPATVGEIGRVKPAHGSGFVGNVFWSNPSGARKVFQKRCMEAGVPYFHPHSFRHLAVSVMAKIPLTEEQKRAFSITLGHANVTTTFGSYCSRNMSNEEAVQIVEQIKAFEAKEAVSGPTFTNEDRATLMGLLEKMKAAEIPTTPDLVG